MSSITLTMLFLQMPKITFFLRSNNDRNKTNVLYCRVSMNFRTTEFSLNEKIDPAYWNQSAQQLKSRNKEQNTYVNTLINSVSYKLKQLAVLDSFDDPRELVARMKGKPKSLEQPILLVDALKEYIRAEAKTKKAETIQNHEVKLKNLLQFQDHLKTVFYINPTDPKNCFDLPTAERFKSWFQEKNKTNNITTASRNVELFVQAFHFTVKKGMIKGFELALYRPERDSTKTTIYLSETEVNRLMTETFISPMYERVRDLYLFQIGTGLSYSDIWGNWELKETPLGMIMTGTRKKNAQNFFVPVNEIALSILDKYNYHLPKYENQTYNRVLKEIAAKIGIQKPLSTHIGRKTFASLMDQKGWSIESIAKMLGHSSIKTTETYYIGQSHKRVLNEMLSRTNK